ncbi:MAG: Flp family type IVb pilin [Polaromonas sp.]|nr:Flp family type IVb pilin [Polaromonas sp.]
MKQVFLAARTFWRDDEGVTSIEYALIASLIAMAIVGALSATGGANGSIWTVWTGKVVAAIGTAIGP